jgi:hypothetical protein
VSCCICAPDKDINIGYIAELEEGNQGEMIVRYKFAFQWCEEQGNPWWVAALSGVCTNYCSFVDVVLMFSTPGIKDSAVTVKSDVFDVPNLRAADTPTSGNATETPCSTASGSNPADDTTKGVPASTNNRLTLTIAKDFQGLKGAPASPHSNSEGAQK